MPDDSKKPLPSPFDKRVMTVLEEPLGEDVVVAYFNVGRAKIPFQNYRWNLHGDGRLFFVRHSGKGGDWQVPLDRPLPKKPALKLDPGQVDSIRQKLEESGFFEHPGYEAVRGHDGTYIVVRARKGDQVHSVVYENVKSPLLEQLAEVAADL